MKSLLEQYFDEMSNMYPSFLAFIGDHKMDDAFENVSSQKHRNAFKRIIRKYENLLVSAPNAHTSDDIDTIILSWIIKDSKNSFRHPFHLLPIDSHNNTIMNFTFYNKTMYQLKTKKDVDNLLSRHRCFMEAVHDMMRNMRVGISKEIVLPALICSRLIESLQKFVQKKDYAIVLPDALAKHQAEVNAFLEGEYAPVLKQFIYFVTTEYAPKCRSSIGLSSLLGGKSMYAYIVKSLTTLDDMTPQIAHKLGLQEVERIKAELHRVKVMLGFSAETPLKRFYKAMMNDPKYIPKSRKALIEDYQRTKKFIDKNVIPANFAHNVKDHVIREVPKTMQATSPGAFYYPPSTLNKSRPGLFYLNTRDLKECPSYTTLALSLHEGKPGHHYQFQYMIEHDIPLHRMYSLDSTSFTEGWGLYAESLADYSSRPSDYFGKLTYEMFRATRLVVDTGIHAMNWSFKKAVKYMIDHVAMKPSEIRTEVERYICMPAQAICYKIGELKLQQWKREWIAKYGDSKNSIQAYHACVLGSGVIPLDVLGQRLKVCPRPKLKQYVVRK